MRTGVYKLTNSAFTVAGKCSNHCQSNFFMFSTASGEFMVREHICKGNDDKTYDYDEFGSRFEGFTQFIHLFVNCFSYEYYGGLVIDGKDMDVKALEPIVICGDKSKGVGSISDVSYSVAITFADDSIFVQSGDVS